jgi:putative ABC transport system permease protein
VRRANVATAAVLGLTFGLVAATLDIVRSYLWRPLPYPESDRLVAVDYPRTNSVSIRTLEDVDWSGARDFADLALSSDADAFTVLGGNAPFSVAGRWMTADVFAMFGIVPAQGRFFTAEEARRGEPLAVIGHGVWQQHFGGRAAVIGQKITARATLRQGREETFTIIGVLPAAFWHLEMQTGLILPLSDVRPPSLLRLRDGIAPAEAASRLTAIARAQVETVASDWSVDVRSAQEAHAAGIQGTLTAGLGAITLLGVASLASLVFLQITRGFARQQEFAIRTALGASRAQLARAELRAGFITGSCAAIVAAMASLAVLRSAGAAVEEYFGRLVPGGTDSLGVNVYPFLVTAALTIITGLILALIRLGAARVVSLPTALAGQLTFTDRRSRIVVRHLVSSSQVAVAFCLLVMATLMLRTAWHQSHLELGFEAAHVLTANVTLHERTYGTLDERRQFFAQFLERIRTLPDVSAAGLSGWLPFRTGPAVWVDAESAGGASTPRAMLRSISPGYLEALNVSLIAGRRFNEDDRADRTRVAIIGRALAQELWGSEGSAVGRSFRIRFGANDRTRPGFGPFTVVGVVENTRESLLEATPPQIYTAFNQEPLAGNAFLHVETPRDPRDLIPQLQHLLRTADPTLSLNAAVPLDTVVNASSVRPEFLARALTLLALAAAAVAIAGLYAVSSWLAQQRQREAALRIALGAPPGSVAFLLARAGNIAVAIGLIAGWIAAAPLTSMLASELRGVSATDLSTRGIVAALLALTSAIALAYPARRAATGDPSRLLRVNP